MAELLDQAKDALAPAGEALKAAYDKVGDPVVDQVTDAYATYAEAYVSPYYTLLGSLSSDEWFAVAAAGLPLLSLLFTLVYLLFRTIFCCGSKKALVAPAGSGNGKKPMAPPPQPPKPRASPPKPTPTPQKKPAPRK